MLTNKVRMMFIFGAHSPFSLLLMCFWCPFLTGNKPCHIPVKCRFLIEKSDHIIMSTYLRLTFRSNAQLLMYHDCQFSPFTCVISGGIFKRKTLFTNWRDARYLPVDFGCYFSSMVDNRMRKASKLSQTNPVVCNPCASFSK